MILQAFSNYLKEQNSNELSTILLYKWLNFKISKTIEDNIDKIIQTELTLSLNKKGNLIPIAKSKTGNNLLKALYNFALSYDQYKFTKWIQCLKASDFNNYKHWLVLDVNMYLKVFKDRYF